MTAFFRQFELVVPGARIPVSAWGDGESLSGVRLDLSPEKAMAEFREAGAPELRDDSKAFPLFAEDLLAYQSRGTHRWQTPIRFLEGTEFQRRVWRGIDQISPGETLTYGALAAKLSAPRATRALGAACGRNPIPLRVPCHRVIAAGGRLGGFTGVLATKRALLEHESGIVSADLFSERLPPDRGESLQSRPR